MVECSSRNLVRNIRNFGKNLYCQLYMPTMNLQSLVQVKLVHSGWYLDEMHHYLKSLLWKYLEKHSQEALVQSSLYLIYV